MPVEERCSPVPDALDLAFAAGLSADAVRFPGFTWSGSQPRAAFRADAQLLRVAGDSIDVEVALASPEGAERTIYSEHAADWILPIVMELSKGVAAELIASAIVRRLKGLRRGDRMPIVRASELVWRD